MNTMYANADGAGGMSGLCKLHGSLTGRACLPGQNRPMNRLLASHSHLHNPKRALAVLGRFLGHRARPSTHHTAWGRCACRAASSTTEATQTAGPPFAQPQEPKPAQKWVRCFCHACTVQHRLWHCTMRKQQGGTTCGIGMHAAVLEINHSSSKTCGVCFLQAASALWCSADRHTASGQLLGRHPELGEDAGALWCALPMLLC